MAGNCGGILGLLLTSVYVFFPKLLNISNIEKINCNINSVNRFLMVEDKWAKWWPGSVEHDNLSNKNVFVYNGYKYVITGNKYIGVLKPGPTRIYKDGPIFSCQ